jgi:hypothetical protein
VQDTASELRPLPYQSVLTLILEYHGLPLPVRITQAPVETNNWCIVKSLVPLNTSKTHHASYSGKRRTGEMIPVEFQRPVRNTQIALPHVTSAITGVHFVKTVYHYGNRTFPDHFDMMVEQPCGHGLHGFGEAFRESVFEFIPPASVETINI